MNNYVRVWIVQTVIMMLVKTKLLFSHRYKKWNMERISHQLNKFDRVLYGSFKIELYYETIFNPLTSLNYRRGKICSSDHYFIRSVLVRILIIILPAEICSLPYLFYIGQNRLGEQKRQKNYLVYLVETVNIYQFIYNSIGWIFQLALVVELSMVYQ